MRKLTLIIAIALCSMIVTLSACGGEMNENELSISMAEMAFSDNDTEFAQKICDTIYAGEEFKELNTELRCRLALLLYRIADTNSDEARMAMAAKCMQSAIEAHRDSVELYINSCNIEDRSQLILIGKLCEAVNGFSEGKFIMGDEEEAIDSLYEQEQVSEQN
jgi:hypothetical protein